MGCDYFVINIKTSERNGSISKHFPSERRVVWKDEPLNKVFYDTVKLLFLSTESGVFGKSDIAAVSG